MARVQSPVTGVLIYTTDHWSAAIFPFPGDMAQVGKIWVLTIIPDDTCKVSGHTWAVVAHFFSPYLLTLLVILVEIKSCNNTWLSSPSVYHSEKKSAHVSIQEEPIVAPSGGQALTFGEPLTPTPGGHLILTSTWSTSSRYHWGVRPTAKARRGRRPLVRTMVVPQIQLPRPSREQGCHGGSVRQR